MCEEARQACRGPRFEISGRLYSRELCEGPAHSVRIQWPGLKYRSLAVDR